LSFIIAAVRLSNILQRSSYFIFSPFAKRPLRPEVLPGRSGLFASFFC